MDFLTNTNIQFYLLAYLVGGIPFGMILAKVFSGVNIKESGSGSIGATNVLRVLKEKDSTKAKQIAIATMILDSSKGALVIGVAKFFELPLETQWAIAVLAVIGHCFSPYLWFEGGKGVATGFGVMAVMLPLEAGIGILLWFLSGKYLKISSLSSLIGLAGLIVVSLMFHSGLGIDSNAPLYLIAFIIVYKHIPNLMRLFQGNESKVV